MHVHRYRYLATTSSVKCVLFCSLPLSSNLNFHFIGSTTVCHSASELAGLSLRWQRYLILRDTKKKIQSMTKLRGVDFDIDRKKGLVPKRRMSCLLHTFL